MRKITITILIICIWGAIFYSYWWLAALSIPLLAYILILTLLAPPVDASLLAELKSPPQKMPTEQNIIDLSGLWEYKTGLSRRWHPVRVPADLCGVPGIAWKPRKHIYRRRVDLAGGEGTPKQVWGRHDEKKKVFLCFGGVGGSFRVFIDGKFAGAFHYGFAPSEIEITELIKGKSSFELRVEITDAQRTGSALNPTRTGSAYAKGLYGAVRIEVRDEIFINSDHTSFKNDRDASMRKLVGVKWVNFLPPYGASVPQWAVQRDIRALKDAGFNMVWVTLMPPTDELLDAADGEGIFVAGEIALSEVLGARPADADFEHLTGWLLGAADHPSFLFWYIRGGNRNLSRSTVEKISAILNKPDLQGKVVLEDDINTGVASCEFRVQSSRFKVQNLVVLPGITRPEEVMDDLAGNTESFILAIDHIDSSMGMDSRSARDGRRAAFDTKILPLLEDARCAGVVLGTMIFSGCRIGLFTEARRPGLALEACRQYLKDGKTIPAAPDRKKSFSHLITLSSLFFIAALALLATKPFLADFLHFPYNVLSFVSLYESACLRVATAAGFAFVAVWRFHALPLKTVEAFVDLSPMIYRAFLRRWEIKFAAFFALWLYLWFAGTWILSLIEMRPFDEIAQITSQASVFDVLFVFLFLTGVPGRVAAGGAAVVTVLYLMNMVSPMGAVAYGMVVFSIVFYVFHRHDKFNF
ncbi:MAG: hypothetical protein AB1546_00225 [bacterium]